MRVLTSVSSPSSCCLPFKWSDKLAVRCHYRASVSLFIILRDFIFVIHTLLHFLFVCLTISLCCLTNTAAIGNCQSPFHRSQINRLWVRECIHLLSFQRRQLQCSHRRLRGPEGLAEGGAMQ